MREGLDLDEKYRASSFADDIDRGEINRAWGNRALVLRHDLKVFRVRKEVCQEGVIGSIELGFVVREAVDEIELFLNGIRPGHF
jgi:hypothetical protein